MLISVQPYLSLGVFGNLNLVEMGLFYTTDETIKRALGVYGDRNESTTYVDEFLEETTEADNVIELEGSVQELALDMAVEGLVSIEELSTEVSVEELMAVEELTTGVSVKELTTEMAVEKLMAVEELPVEVSVKGLATEVASMAGDTFSELTLESLLAELGLYLPVIEVRPIRFIIFTDIFTLMFTVIDSLWYFTVINSLWYSLSISLHILFQFHFVSLFLFTVIIR